MRKYADVDYDNGELAACIDQIIHSKRDREIGKAWLCDNIKQEAIAELFGVSVGTVKRVTTRVREKAFRKMGLI